VRVDFATAELGKSALATSHESPEVSLESFSNVLEAIYACVLDRNLWNDAIPMIAELTRSQRCALVVHANDRNELAYHLGYDEEHWRLNETKYRGVNPFFTPVQLLPLGAVATQAMLVDDDEFLESKYYQEWVKPQALGDVLLMKVFQTEQCTALLAASRLESQPRYGDAEIRLFTLLSPHICRVVAISDVLNFKDHRVGRHGRDASHGTLTTRGPSGRG
jgi:hypothetical protein